MNSVPYFTAKESDTPLPTVSLDASWEELEAVIFPDAARNQQEKAQ